jgi:hypothetical protein
MTRPNNETSATELPPADAPYKSDEGMKTHRANQAAAHANMHRLRTERLIREAANPPQPKPTRKKKPSA